jgi:hypothetical protein
VTGRPIQVETSFVERFPSADTRLPRMRESDSVIEVSYHFDLAHVEILLTWSSSILSIASFSRSYASLRRMIL